MKHSEAIKIVNAHLDWVDDKTDKWNYTEKAFNDALRVLINDCQHPFGYVQNGKCLNCGKTLEK